MTHRADGRRSSPIWQSSALKAQEAQGVPGRVRGSVRARPNLHGWYRAGRTKLGAGQHREDCQDTPDFIVGVIPGRLGIIPADPPAGRLAVLFPRNPEGIRWGPWVTDAYANVAYS